MCVLYSLCVCCVYVCVHAYVCMWVCACVCGCVLVHVCVCVWVCTRMYVCVHVCRYICARVRGHRNIYTIHSCYRCKHPKLLFARDSSTPRGIGKIMCYTYAYYNTQCFIGGIVSEVMHSW